MGHSGHDEFLSEPKQNQALYHELSSLPTMQTFEGRFDLIQNGQMLAVLDRMERKVDYALSWETFVVRGVKCATSLREYLGEYAYGFASKNDSRSLSLYVTTEVLIKQIPLLFTKKSRFESYRIFRTRELGLFVYLLDDGELPRLLTDEDIDHISWKSDTPIPSEGRMCVLSSQKLWGYF